MQTQLKEVKKLTNEQCVQYTKKSTTKKLSYFVLINDEGSVK